MPHRHDDEYQHRHDHDAEPHRHRLLEVIEHAHGAHRAQRHSHIIMTAPAESASKQGDHRHRLEAPFDHDHPAGGAAHRHPLGDIEHDEPDRHWHEIDIIELVIERPA